MTLENLQSSINAALQRIDDIRSRFESDVSAASRPGGDAGTSFGSVLSDVMARPETPMPVPAGLENLIQDKAAQNGLDPDLLKAVIRNESGFNPKARSPVGAEGLMQLMPGTARGLGVTNSFDPAQNIDGGARYLKTLLQKYDQSVPKALAAYNAGPGVVDRYGGIPPYAETTGYVKKVMKSYQAYDRTSPPPSAQAPRIGLAGVESQSRNLGVLDTEGLFTSRKPSMGGLE